MILYHVSWDLDHNGHFKPRVPQDRSYLNEDDKIKRVCVGKSIEDCFTAMPSGGYRLDELIEEQNGLFKVFKIDTEKLGISFEDIIDDNVLFEKDLVRDALHTNENWILKSFTVPEEDSFIIKIDGYNEESEDIVPFDVLQEAMDGDGDYDSIYWNKFHEYTPCMVVITDLEYTIINEEKLTA